MTRNLREDIAYFLLEKIAEVDIAKTNERLTQAEISAQNTESGEIMMHLEYLQEKGFIATPTTENISTENTFIDEEAGKEPEVICLAGIKLTPQGAQLLKRLQANPPSSRHQEFDLPLVQGQTPFLKKVMVKGNLPDIYDARDVTEVIFRAIRDLMTNDVSDRIAQDLRREALSTHSGTAHNEIAELWRDTNPIVRFLSRLRPPLEIDSDLFFQRIRQEAGLPRSTNPELVVQAVFAATKDELSEARIKEIAECLPEKLRRLWESA